MVLANDAISPRRTYDAVIVGAGVIGASVALALTRAGWRTLNVDREGMPGHGSTSASAGILRVHATSRDAVVLAAEALPYWEGWADFVRLPPEERLAEFHRCGSIIFDDGSGYGARAEETLAGLGEPHERWDAERLAEHLPYFDLHAFGPPRLPDDEDFGREPEGVIPGALYTPSSGFVGDPALAAQNLMAAARLEGAECALRATVVEIRRAGGRVLGVTLADGTRVDCPVVVNAAGPHSSRLNRMAGVEEGMRVRTRAIRQELHQVTAPPEIDYLARGLHVVDGDLGINFRPERGNGILVGGNGAACDPTVEVADPDAHDPAVSLDVWDRHVLRLAQRLPTLRIPSRPSGVAGLYDITDDWAPIYDRTDLDGFYVAIGTSGNQFKTAPLVGELMATLIDAVESGRDVDAEPLAVTGTHTGREIHLSAYSRLRSPDRGLVTTVNG
ncbi:NAD(P)/FAD-dependent oxidoreductase [Microtetraspora niveoalba]|uniref:NAD(P)/FAD-dependent oxidoreductase n=1 Tax=Microtetraspora niveoalba TaxID=46175 RepID=UPI00083728F3|nr:FAD-dependent oxidoreductase [Microtetraspora niveoalba]